ncbi:MAG: NERD domain-containing protein [Lachnospiraceae bacterium]|nr:NERD domain-containing protein [Lachnospiraceae bacterium]
MLGYIIAISIILLIVIILVLVNWPQRKERGFTPEKLAGIVGEVIAGNYIKEILRKGDHLFRNVPIEYNGEKTELDYMILNKNGVFIIEVKNLSGKLYGREDDLTWEKHKTTESGNVYEKTIDNPIRQVKREERIFGQYLRSEGIRVWVEGYVFFVENNSSVKSPYILRTNQDISRVIHRETNTVLKEEVMQKILQKYQKIEVRS